MWDNIEHVIFLLLSVAIEGFDGASCQYSYYSYFYGNQYSYKYCSNGCCGSTYSSYCCYDQTYYYNGHSTSTGVIAGSVIGGIVGLGIVVAVIVCVSVACCATKTRGRIGHVHRVQVNRVGLVTTTTTSAYPMRTMYGQPAMPPPYMGPPPSYGDAVYPPYPHSHQPFAQPSPAAGQAPAYTQAPPPPGYNIGLPAHSATR